MPHNISSIRHHREFRCSPCVSLRQGVVATKWTADTRVGLLAPRDVWSQQRDLRNRTSQMETLGILAFCGLDDYRPSHKFFDRTWTAGNFCCGFGYSYSLRRTPHRRRKEGLASIAVKFIEQI